jgi:hypothetical protein
VGIYKIVSRFFIFLFGVFCLQGALQAAHASEYHTRAADDFAIALSESPEYGELLELFVDIQAARAEQASIKVLRPKVHALIKRIEFVQKYAQDPLLSGLLAWCYAQKGCGKRTLAAWHKALIAVAAVAVLAGSAFAVGRKLDSRREQSRTSGENALAAVNRGLNRGPGGQERGAAQPVVAPVPAPRVTTDQELIARLTQAYEDDIDRLYQYGRETLQPVCRSCKQPLVCGDSVIIALPRAGYADPFAEGVHELCGLLSDRWMDGMRRRPRDYRRYEVPLRECNLELPGRSLAATASGSDRGLLRTERGDVFYLQTSNGASGRAWRQAFEQSLPGDIFDYCVRGFDLAATPERTIVFDFDPYHKYARLRNIDPSVCDGRQFWIYKRRASAATTGGASAGAGEGTVTGAMASSGRSGLAGGGTAGAVPPRTPLRSVHGGTADFKVGQLATSEFFYDTAANVAEPGCLFRHPRGSIALCLGKRYEPGTASYKYSFQAITDSQFLLGDLADYYLRQYSLDAAVPNFVERGSVIYDKYGKLTGVAGAYVMKQLWIYKRRVLAAAAGGAAAGAGKGPVTGSGASSERRGVAGGGSSWSISSSESSWTEAEPAIRARRLACGRVGDDALTGEGPPSWPVPYGTLRFRQFEDGNVDCSAHVGRLFRSNNGDFCILLSCNQTSPGNYRYLYYNMLRRDIGNECFSGAMSDYWVQFVGGNAPPRSIVRSGILYTAYFYLVDCIPNPEAKHIWFYKRDGVGDSSLASGVRAATDDEQVHSDRLICHVCRRDMGAGHAVVIHWYDGFSLSGRVERKHHVMHKFCCPTLSGLRANFCPCCSSDVGNELCSYVHNPLGRAGVSSVDARTAGGATVAASAGAGEGTVTGAARSSVGAEDPHIKIIPPAIFQPLTDRTKANFCSSNPTLDLSDTRENFIVDLQSRMARRYVYISKGQTHFCVLQNIEFEGDLADYQVIESGEVGPDGYSLYAQFSTGEEGAPSKKFLIYRRNDVRTLSASGAGAAASAGAGAGASSEQRGVASRRVEHEVVDRIADTRIFSLGVEKVLESADGTAPGNFDSLIRPSYLFDLSNEVKAFCTRQVGNSYYFQEIEGSLLTGSALDYYVFFYEAGKVAQNSRQYNGMLLYKYGRLQNVVASQGEGEYWLYRRLTLAPTTGGATAGAGAGAGAGSGVSSELSDVVARPSTASHVEGLPLYELGQLQTVTTSGVQPRVGSLFATQDGQQALCVGLLSESFSLYAPEILTYSYQILNRNLDGDLSDYQVRSYDLSDMAPSSIVYHGDEYDACASFGNPRGEYADKLVRIYRRRVPITLAGGASAVSMPVKILTQRNLIPLRMEAYGQWRYRDDLSYVNEPDVVVSWPLRARSFLTMTLDGQRRWMYIFDQGNFFVIRPDDQLEGSMCDYTIVELGEDPPLGYSLYAQFDANKQDGTTSTFLIYRRNGS